MAQMLFFLVFLSNPIVTDENPITGGDGRNHADILDPTTVSTIEEFMVLAGQYSAPLGSLGSTPFMSTYPYNPLPGIAGSPEEAITKMHPDDARSLMIMINDALTSASDFKKAGSENTEACSAKYKESKNNLSLQYQHGAVDGTSGLGASVANSMQVIHCISLPL